MADTTKTLICPACGKEMEKIYIERAQCFIDVCTNGCGGIFFDNREFKKFDEDHESIDEIKKTLEGKKFNKVDASYKRICPVCGMKMMKNSTSIKGEIIVDDCYGCGGKFLDFGELEKIRAEYKTEEERSQDVLNYLKASMGEEYDAMHAHKITKQNKPKKSGLFNNIIDKFL